MIPSHVKKTVEKLKDRLKSLEGSVDVRSDKSAGNSSALWSSGPAYTILPLGLELGGSKPSAMSAKEPANKKNIFAYYVEGTNVTSCAIYGATGKKIATESFFADFDYVYSARFDADGVPVRIMEVSLEGGEPKYGCRFEDDGEYWYYEYHYENGVLISMITYSSNSAPGVKLFVEYEAETVVGIYFLRDCSKIYVYG